MIRQPGCFLRHYLFICWRYSSRLDDFFTGKMCHFDLFPFGVLLILNT